MRAAGAVVWRPRDPHLPVEIGQTYQPDDIEVLLVHRPRYDDWSWPKGKAENNEPLLAAGVREVEEETGVIVEMHAPLTTQRYRLGSGQTKEVYYWIGTPVRSGGVSRSRIPVTPASSKEIDTTRWVSAYHARKMLTRRGDRRLLDDVLARASDGSLVTATLAIVRHASAVSRAQWGGSDATRPLNRVGGVQALDLVDLLSALGVTRLLSSPWSRCTASLEPYAAVAGLSVVKAEELTEESIKADPKSAGDVIKKLLKRPAEPVAVCGHRPGLPAMLRPLRTITNNQIARNFPTEDPWLRTSEILVAHVAYVKGSESQPEVVALESHRTIKRQ